MQGDEWLTVTEIADRLKVSEQVVRRWLRAGLLDGQNFGGRAGYRVRATDLETFLGRGSKKAAA